MSLAFVQESETKVLTDEARWRMEQDARLAASPTFEADLDARLASLARLNKARQNAAKALAAILAVTR